MIIEFNMDRLIDIMDKIHEVDPLATLSFSNQTSKFYVPNRIYIGGDGWEKSINHHNENPVTSAGFTLNEMMSCTDPDTRYLICNNHKFIYTNDRFVDLGER